MPWVSTDRWASGITQSVGAPARPEPVRMFTEPVRSDKGAFERFKSMLSPQQLADYEAFQQFAVRGSLGHRFVLMCGGACAGVVYVEENQPLPVGPPGTYLGSVCCYPRFAPFTALRYLGTKLALEADERHFLEVGYGSGRMPPRI